jgi:predicted DCC family thiol-disulfide oxidoreductase YuxK
MTDPGVSLASSGAVVVYDGECIFCQNYVRMLRLRESVGKVDLVDARGDDPRVQELIDQGYDLDEGMVFSYQHKIFHGSDAVHALALLCSASTLFNRFNAHVLSKPNTARLLYPWLKAGRRVTLWLRGRTMIARRMADDPVSTSDNKTERAAEKVGV